MNINEYNTFIREKNYQKINNFLIKEVINLDQIQNEDVLHIIKDFTLFQYHEFDTQIQSSIELLFLSKKYTAIVKNFYSPKNKKIYIDIYVMQAFYKLGQIEKSLLLKDKVYKLLKSLKAWNYAPLFFKAIEEGLNRKELSFEKVEYFIETSLYQKLEAYLIDNIDSQENPQKLDSALELVKQRSNYLYEKLSLYKKVKKSLVSIDDKVKALILFPEKKLDFLKEESKLKVSIEYNEQREFISPAITTTKKNEKEKEDLNFIYIRSPEEDNLIKRLRLNDLMFEEYNRDLAISFINMEMYELLVMYVERFEQTPDRLYLKLEALLKLGRYSRVIDEVNTRVEEESIAFTYLKALAYKELGFNKQARKVFKDVATTDSRFRKVREFLDES